MRNICPFVEQESCVMVYIAHVICCMHIFYYCPNLDECTRKIRGNLCLCNVYFRFRQFCEEQK